MNEPRLEHQTLKVRQLIDDFQAGRIVVPEFQRDYVWKPSRAPLLIDSLYRGFPISSLLLWQSAEVTRSRQRDPGLGRSALMSWLIDGQQRVITLSRTLSGDEGIEVVFHPERDEFRLANAATRKNRKWFRISDLWDDELYRQLRRSLNDGQIDDRHEAQFERVRRILDYEVPIVRMADHSFENAVTAFTRINQLGVRLKKEDIESARVAARHTGFIADEVTPFLEELRRQGFTRLNIMHLFRVCAFIAKPDGRDRTPLHELEKREVLAAWKVTRRAAEQAVAVIRGELGLANPDMLGSGALLVPLIVMCATSSPAQRDSRALAGWLALSTLLHRYRGSSEASLDQDLRACRSSDPIGSLLTNLRRVRSPLVAEPRDFSGPLTDRNALLAVYVACLNRGILDFAAGAQPLRQVALDRHYILPRAQFPESGRSVADNIANIAFIAANAKNKSIGVTGPEFYLKRMPKGVLRSQCVPEDPSLWSVERAIDFWASRELLLANAFNDFVQKALPQRRLGNG